MLGGVREAGIDPGYGNTTEQASPSATVGKPRHPCSSGVARSLKGGRKGMQLVKKAAHSGTVQSPKRSRNWDSATMGPSLVRGFIRAVGRRAQSAETPADYWALVTIILARICLEVTRPPGKLPAGYFCERTVNKVTAAANAAASVLGVEEWRRAALTLALEVHSLLPRPAHRPRRRPGFMDLARPRAALTRGRGRPPKLDDATLMAFARGVVKRVGKMPVTKGEREDSVRATIHAIARNLSNREGRLLDRSDPEDRKFLRRLKADYYKGKTLLHRRR